MTADATLADRLARLERRTRRATMVSTTAVLLLVGTWVLGAAAPAQTSDEVRTRLLVIEDSTGQARIRLGAPMPDGRQVVGMQILNPQGIEQWGLSYKADGSVGMGFDTRPGVGDPRNTERLNLGVTADGRGWIRWLDNETKARLWLGLNEDDEPVILFYDWPSNERIVFRELNFDGERAYEIMRD